VSRTITHVTLPQAIKHRSTRVFTPPSALGHMHAWRDIPCSRSIPQPCHTNCTLVCMRVASARPLSCVPWRLTHPPTHPTLIRRYVHVDYEKREELEHKVRLPV
jgi:hypothetical protein